MTILAKLAGSGRRVSHATPGYTLTLLAVGLTLTASPVAAQTDYFNTDAGRPIRVEDAYPIERRALEIQVAPLRLERARGGVYSWGFEPEIAWGVIPRTQLELGVPLVYTDLGAGRSQLGLAGLEFSVLHNLNMETSIPAFAIASELLVPAGALGPDKAYVSLKGIATRTYPWARFHVNGQYTFGERAVESGAGSHGAAELSQWMGGVAVDRTFPLKSLLVTAEVVAQQPLAVGSDIAWDTGAGARYQLSPRLAVDGGAGYRLTGERGWFVTFGAAVAVGLPWSER